MGFKWALRVRQLGFNDSRTGIDGILSMDLSCQLAAFLMGIDGATHDPSELVPSSHLGSMVQEGLILEYKLICFCNIRIFQVCVWCLVDLFGLSKLVWSKCFGLAKLVWR